MPLIPLLAALFFYAKYLIDKYNILFVYSKTYDSGGKIKNLTSKI